MNTRIATEYFLKESDIKTSYPKTGEPRNMSFTLKIGRLRWRY